jgi:hypothetical protein
VWLASTSADRTMKIWRRDSGPTAGEWTCLQTFDYAPKMMECVALTHIPGTSVVLMAAAGVDLMIHLYVCKLDGQKVSTAHDTTRHDTHY